MFPAVFTHFFVTLFSYNIPIEYANRVIDLFWIFEEKIILDCLIHILKIQKNKMMEMELEILHHYIRSDIVLDTILVYGLQKALPF
jgi:hypothetical protein